MSATTAKSKKNLRSFSASRRMSAALRKAITTDDVVAFRDAFLEDLARPLKRLRKKLKSSTLLALWSDGAIELSGRERELAASLDEISSHQLKTREGKKKRSSKDETPYEEVVANWLVESSAVPGPWETIALAEILLREGSRLSAERFVATLSVLAEAMQEKPIGGLFADRQAAESEDTVRDAIATGESRWLCSLLLSPLKADASLQKLAMESLGKVVCDNTDAEGLVHGSLLNRLPHWLAVIARSSFWSDIFEQPLWSDETATRLTAVTERAAMLLVPVSQHHGDDDAPEVSAPSLAELLESLLPMTGSQWDRRLQKLVRQCQQPAAVEVSKPKSLKKKPAYEETAKDGESKKGESRDRQKLATSWESDASCVAILRSSLDADADLATLEWHSADSNLLLAAAGVPMLAGKWDWSVKLNGQMLPGPTTWKCSCWFLDPETVFVELEGEDSAPVKRVRQLLLAPRDRFAVMTDSVTVKDGTDQKIELTTSVPLVEGTLCAVDSVTRELSLITGPRTVRVFPVWMEDDRVQHSLGSCREADGRLELSAVGQGGVTMPLALDWHPKRTESPADWARLTVTQVRRVVSSQEACGFRVRIGDHQVLIYRSLVKPVESRAVMGLHTWDETVYSRVPHKPGHLSPLVEVESPE